MNITTIKDVNLIGKKIIVRVGCDMPLDDNGQITDDLRIRESLATIKYLLNTQAEKIIMMTHMGRPDGQVVEKLKTDVVAKRFEELLGVNVEKLNDCIGDEVKLQIEKSVNRVFFLENLRFYKEEEKGDENFAKKLADLADVYVNDAFSVAHRAHASTAIIAKFLPSYFGFLMEKEVRELSKAKDNPQKPYVAILGGAKVSDKILVIEKLLEKVDSVLVGGAMAYTFLKAQGQNIGKSRVEEDRLEIAKEIMAKAEAKGVKFLLPIDHLTVDSIDNPSGIKFADEILDDQIAVDIGPKTVELYEKELANSKTVLWNGPMGIFEDEKYANGTKNIGEFLTTLKADVIVGGGDTAAAAQQFKVADKFTHVSTGGGASLEFLEGKELPGIKAIEEKIIK